MDRNHEEVDLLEVLDRVLSAALREVRGARARRPVVTRTVAVPAETKVRKSQTRSCVEILEEAKRPLHITALLGALEARGVRTTRETLGSAIGKKIAPAGPFVRTGPNTFGLAKRDTQGA